MSGNNQNEDLVEVPQEETQYWVKQNEDLNWLMNTPQFQNVILNGYFNIKAVNQVSLISSDYTKGTPGALKDIMESLAAISELRQHFITIRNMGGIQAEDLAEEQGLSDDE